MRDVIVASRYAKALFMVTEKRGETVRALQDLQDVAKVLDPKGPVAAHLSVPQLRLTDKRAALKHVLESRVVRIVQLFVDLLLVKRRMGELPDIVTEFEALTERAIGVQRAHVVSAVPMTEAEIEKLQTSLERQTAMKIKLTREVDGTLIGGALVRLGDRVIDRSVRTLLEAIEKQLSVVSV